MPRLRRSSYLAVLCFVLLLSAIAGQAQSGNSPADDSISNFFNSIAKMTYQMAWPTATYKSWSFAGPVKDVDGGYDVVIKLSGESGIDGSDLWLKLGFAIRSTGIERVWVVDHNAFWIPPFKTMQSLGELTAELSKQYQQSQNAPAPAPPAPAQPAAPPPPPAPSRAMAVCVSNGTGTVLKFSYHWGADAWSQDALASSAARVYWFPLQSGENTAPRFYIEYDKTLAPGYTPQDYELKQYPVNLPANCLSSKQYIFTASGTDILLQSLN